MRQILIPVLALWSSLCGGMSLAEGGPVARIGESGEFLELEYQVTVRCSKTRSRSIGQMVFVISAPGLGSMNVPPSIPLLAEARVHCGRESPFWLESRSPFSRQKGDLRSTFPVTM